MKKYVPYIFVVLLVSSCSFAYYYQNRTKSSTQKVENPTSLSADSSSINVEMPISK